MLLRWTARDTALTIVERPVPLAEALQSIQGDAVIALRQNRGRQNAVDSSRGDGVWSMLNARVCEIMQRVARLRRRITSFKLLGRVIGLEIYRFARGIR